MEYQRYANAELGCAREYVGAGVVGASAQPGGVLLNIEQALQEVLKRLHANTADLRGLADRIVGPQPEAVVAKDGASMKDPPQLRRLEDLVGYLIASTEDLGNQVTRLHRL